MKTFAIAAAVIALSLASGASAFAEDPPAAAQPGAAPAPASDPAANPPAAAAAPGAAGAKGKIFFFRPSRLPGALYTYHVVEVGDDGHATKDSPRIGDLPNGKAFSVEVEPGIHSYNITGPMADNRAQDRLRMEVEPGVTYYVEDTFRMGMTGGFMLVPADEARFTSSKVKLGGGH